ncbi:TPA: sensor histidine kinase [Streptococcus suis]|uniref:histidine kinase n=1 Tax=Streptococcus suis 6407 TaxID=1214179 RepID=A0A075SF81_STRSU|nr:sensor histidine kinase [Streptococcus suis]AIG44012.1 histidine kinase [Streptococcus suis 6407]HEL2622862.1 sensor histidine kinase [Streptococcus suis]HEL2635016.1 sensor histidine kinase [Streptococcus suis]HEM2591919.1 sensor histidine kinase [Streptococcus suis]HEM3239310.1 sensor histidine kinase [Streptococcus suis 6407]
MNKDDFGSLVPGFLTSWLGHRLIFLIAYAVFDVAILAYSSLFDIKRNLVFYAILLLSICWLLALLWDFVREFSRFGKIWRGQKVATGTASERLLQEKVQWLEVQNKKILEKQRQEQTELDDYYTLWAHQMKTPIAASQLLVKEVDSSPVRHQLESELFKIEQYTGLVLNYLRLQSFHDDLVIEAVNLEELVRSLVKKYSLFFIQANTSLDLGQLDRLVKTDKRWLGLLIEQILSNALKYCQEGTVSIFLDGDELVIRDTGIGIAESDLERVFERGFSGFNGRRTQQSSGLGLYLSRKIAAELGYSLKLQSKVGQGTEVRIGIKEVELIFD